MDNKTTTVGIGKIILSSLDNDSYNIPHLHFLICKSESFYESVNLEFGLVASNEDAKSSVEALTKLLVEHILLTIHTFGFGKLTETVESAAMDSYWKEYRIFEFRLAEQKKDVGHGMVQSLARSIKQQIFKEYGITPEAKFSVVEKAA